MLMHSSLVRIETLTGHPLTIQDAQLYVRSQLVQLRFPTVNGGLIWNRPVAIVVRTLNGQEKIIPISDRTRTVMFTLAGLCLTGMFVLVFLRRKKSES
jgi:LPXTG-motif cell wall-anchored protein